MDGWRERLGLVFATGVLTSSTGPVVAAQLERRWPGLDSWPGLLVILALTWLAIVVAGLQATR